MGCRWGFILLVCYLSIFSGKISAQTHGEPDRALLLALLIGIDTYQHLPTELQLDGCKNDVALMRQLLLEHFGVPAKNITILLDQEATRATIIGQMKGLLKKVHAAGPGARVVFFYSGHGSQKLDTNGDETDGRDETLVAYDSTLSDGQADLVDDEIEVFLQRLVALQAHTTVIFDCCHSGTGVRGATKTRSLDRPIPVDAKKNVQMVAKPALPGVVFISACQPYEKEPEYYSQDSQKTFGLLTYHLVQAIYKEGKSASYRSVFQRLQSQYTAFSQAPTPTMEGDEARLIFGIQARELPKVVKVVSVIPEKNTVQLSIGSLLGITPGSVFCLVRNAEDIPNQGEIQGKHILAVIQQVDAFQSWAQVIEKAERQKYQELIHSRFLQDHGVLREIQPGYDAVELVQNYGNLRLKLYLEKEILTIENKTPVLKGQPLAVAQLLPGFQKTLQRLMQEKVIAMVEDLRQADAVLRMGNRTAVVVWGGGSDLAETPITTTDPAQHEPKGFGGFPLQDTQENWALLEKILIQFNKVRNLLALQPQEEELSCSSALVSLGLNRGKWVAREELARSKDLCYEISHGQKFGITFTNHSAVKVYPTVIYLGNDLEVTIYYPQRGQYDYEVLPGQTKLLGKIQIDTSQTVGRETTKIVVTTEPVDLRAIELPKLERSKGVEEAEKTAMGGLVLQMVFGKQRIGHVGQSVRGSASLLEDPPQWTVLTSGWKTVKR